MEYQNSWGKISQNLHYNNYVVVVDDKIGTVDFSFPLDRNSDSIAVHGLIPFVRNPKTT